MCKEAKILLVLSALFTFAMGLSGIFVNVFFWRQTSDFVVIVIYNLLHYIATPITFFIAGILAKKKNGIWSLRLGLLFFALFYGLILLIGDKGKTFIYLLGIIYGIAAGFYWLAYNTLSFDFTSVNNRDTYNGYNGSFTGIAAAIAPITSGYIITRFVTTKGYSIVFTTTLIIFVVLILISMILKCKNYGSKLDFKKAVSSNGDEWRRVRKAIGIWGLRDTTIVFLVNILIIETTKSELSLGKFTLMASLLGSVSFILVQRIIKPPHRKLSIYMGTIGSFVAVLGLIIKTTYGTLLFYILLDAFFVPFFLIQLSSSTFNVINRAHDEDMRIEYMINRDLVLNGGRIISSIILLILLMSFKNHTVLAVYLVFIGLAPVVAGYFLSTLKRVLEGK